MAGVVAGSSVPGLAKDIATSLKKEFFGVSTGRFPDGELHVKLENPDLPKKVYYVQTMAPLPNQRLTELLLTSDLLKDLGVKEIVAIIPYEGAAIKKIVSIDIHLHRLQLGDIKELTNIEIIEVSAMPLLATKCPLRKPLVIAPDSEAKRWAESAARVLGTEYGAMEKNRVTPTEVEVSFGDMEVEGRNVLIVDDIVSTGGTMIETAQLLKKMGAKEICAAFTHAVFSSPECVSNLFNSGIRDLISTNTIQNEFAEVNVAGLIASTLS
jgi:ribose-phosphate pyrophosphokinase